MLFRGNLVCKIFALSGLNILTLAWGITTNLFPEFLDEQVCEECAVNLGEFVHQFRDYYQ